MIADGATCSGVRMLRRRSYKPIKIDVPYERDRRSAYSGQECEEVFGKGFYSELGVDSEINVAVEVARSSLIWQGIGRKLMLVDEPPQGALPRYERDVAVRTRGISKRAKIETITS